VSPTKGSGTGPGTGTIERDDIEKKLREIRGEIDEVGSSARSYLLAVGAAAAVVVVAAAFLLGKRKGKKKRTVVEIRRI
jgi:hypothetical protein